MALITLFATSEADAGRHFTAAGFASEAGRFDHIRSLVSLGEERNRDGVVERSARDELANTSRTAGYTPTDQPGIASDYWDQLIQFDNNGTPAQIRRDQITGVIQIDNSFLQPTGTVSSFIRYEGLTSDGSSINAAFQIDGGSWIVSTFMPAEGAQFHSAITAGDDTIIGTAGSDQIQAGAGVNRLQGKGGADTFYVAIGQKSKTVKRKKESLGLLIGSQSQANGKSKKIYTYDNSVDIIEDFEQGSDMIALQGNPKRFSFNSINGDSWIFSGKGDNNLLAIVLNTNKISASDVASW